MGLFSSIGNIASAVANPMGSAVGLGTTDIGMDMLTGGAVSNAKSVAETNQSQMALAQKQMDFQERMSNTAYERAMNDMRKSGLNPMLAFDKGGASTPSGAMATLTAPRKGDIGAGLANTAKEALGMSASLQNTHSQTQLNKANAQVADVSAEKLTANAKESEANTQYTQQLKQKAKADTERAKQEAKRSRQDVERDEARRGIDKKLAPVDAIIERIGNAAGIVGSAFRGFTGGRRGSGQTNQSSNHSSRRDQGADSYHEKTKRYFNQNGGIN